MIALERSQRLTHMTGRNWFFVALARDARTGAGVLRDWRNETGAAGHLRHLSSYAVDDSPHPDGMATWAEGSRQTTFVLEYDTGTETLGRLAGKLDSYKRAAAAMAAAGTICPPLLFAFTSPRREQSARQALAGTDDARWLRIATAALDPQHASPAGPVWLPLRDPARQVRLALLEEAMPDPLHVRQTLENNRREEEARRLREEEQARLAEQEREREMVLENERQARLYQEQEDERERERLYREGHGWRGRW